MSNIKKFTIISICFLIVFGLSLNIGNTLDDDFNHISGKCYQTNIKAYINGKYIDSYNINGETYVEISQLSKYGYDVVQNDDNNTTILYSNYYPEKSVIENEVLAYPLYSYYGEYKAFIEYIDPEFESIGTSRGPFVRIGRVKDKVTIQFAKDIKAEYLTADYIPIYYSDKDVSEYFSYDYSKDKRQLYISMKPDSFSNYHFGKLNTSTGDYYDGEEEFTVYFLRGIEDVDAEINKTTFKYRVKFDLNTQRTKSLNKFIGEYNSDEDVAYVIGELGMKHQIINLNSKKLIFIEALGNFYWDQERRNIYTYSSTFRENQDKEFHIKLKEISKPIIENANNELIKSTYPRMVIENTLYDTAVEKIYSSMNQVKITFNKPISMEELDRKYIAIYMMDRDVGHHFDHYFDKETNTLTLTLSGNRYSYGDSHLYDEGLFSKVFYDEEDNVVDSYLGSRFDIYLMKGIRFEDGDTLEDTMRLTCDITWYPHNQTSDNGKSSEHEGYIKEVTTWNINDSKIINFREMSAKDYRNDNGDAAAIIYPNNLRKRTYDRRFTSPLYKGSDNDWISHVSSTTELVEYKHGGIIEKVNNIDSDIVIVFNKDIDSKYINDEYIKINSLNWHRGYIYDYNNTNRTLIIKPITEPEDNIKSDTYDIYFNKGITTKSGEILLDPIRITIGTSGAE